jgi:peptidylprolyl isomerase
MSVSYLLTCFLAAFAISAIQACKSDIEKKPPAPTVSQEDLIRRQKEVTRIENEDIESYIRRRNLTMLSTETGLRYQITREGSGDRMAADGDKVRISYRIGLLDGSTVYSSDSTGNLEFVVGKSDFASGLQEGIRLMKTGDEAILIVPSHLAYGLTGDGNRISHYDVLVIDLALLEIIE